MPVVIADSAKHRQTCQQRQTAPSPYLLRTKSIFGPKSPQDRPPTRRSLVTIVGSRGSDSTWGTPERDSSRSAPSLAGASSDEHTSELQSLLSIAYAVFCLKKKNSTSQTIKDW